MNLHFLLWTILLAQSAIVTSGQPIRIENQTDLNKIAIHLFDHILKLVREAFNSHDQAHLNQLVESSADLHYSNNSHLDFEAHSAQIHFEKNANRSYIVIEGLATLKITTTNSNTSVYRTDIIMRETDTLPYYFKVVKFTNNSGK